MIMLLAPGLFRIQGSPWQQLSTLSIVAYLVVAAFYVFSGWALVNRKDWSRVMIIVASVLVLFSFPLGTALGIYGLWAMFTSRSRDEFPRYIGGTPGQQLHG
jgi:amino acid transporter